MATPLPASVSARVLTRSANASPAVAVSCAVPPSSRWSTVSVAVGGVVGGVAGGVGFGVGFGEVVPPPEGGAGFGLGEPVCGRCDGVCGEGPVPARSSLRLPGSAPVPSGISWVPLR
ncbi:hypothetical protein GCM10020295_63150 [Streptomyces cinereospinus]